MALCYYFRRQCRRICD